MKKILFIGGAGFIGSNLIKWLSDGEHELHVCEPSGANIQKCDIPFYRADGDLC